MKNVLGIGIVGAGSISLRGLLPHLTQEDVLERARVVAVSDNVAGRGPAAAEKFGVAHGYDSYDELLSDPAVDIVAIATPIGIHFEQGLRAIRAGKNVYFNKTMTTTVQEANELISEAGGMGVKLVASPGQMLNPLNRRIRDLVRDGALGHIAWAATGAAMGAYHEQENVRQGQDVLSNIDPSWYYRKPGGGPLYDMTVYGLHALTGILGPARRVTAMSGVGLKERSFQGRVVKCDTDDNTLMVLDFGNALFAFVYGTFAGNLVPAFGRPTIMGTAGTIAGDELNGKKIEIPPDPKSGEPASLPHVVGVHRKMEEAHVFEDVMQLVDWVRDGVPPVPTVEHARHVIDIIESAYRAAETGESQALGTTFTPVVW